MDHSQKVSQFTIHFVSILSSKTFSGLLAGIINFEILFLETEFGIRLLIKSHLIFLKKEYLFVYNQNFKVFLFDDCIT